MNKTYQILLVLLILTSLNVLLTFNNGYAGPIVKLETDPIDAQIIHIGGLTPEKVLITAKTEKQNLQFIWNVDGPGELLKTAPNQMEFIPPDEIDGAADQTTITVTTTDNEGNQGSDELTFILIPLSSQEQLIVLKVKLNTESYEALIEQEQQGVSIDEKIVPILEEIIRGLKETKDIYEAFSQTYPEISQSLDRIQEKITSFEKELSKRPSFCEFDIIGLFIQDLNGNNELVGGYSIKPGKSITIIVDFTNPCNREFGFAWAFDRGGTEDNSKKTVTYTAPMTTGGDYIEVNVLDQKTEKVKNTRVNIEVRE